MSDKYEITSKNYEELINADIESRIEIYKPSHRSDFISTIIPLAKKLKKEERIVVSFNEDLATIVIPKSIYDYCEEVYDYVNHHSTKELKDIYKKSLSNGNVKILERSYLAIRFKRFEAKIEFGDSFSKIKIDLSHNLF